MNSNTPSAYENIVPPVGGMSRLVYNYNRYVAIFNTYEDIACIAFEKQIPQMRYGGYAGSILPLAENIGVLKLAIMNSAIPRNPEMVVLGVPPGDIKSFATNNAKATKEDMIAAVNGHHIKSIKYAIPEHSVNDVADAYHLARYVKSLYGTEGLDKYIEKEMRGIHV